MIICEAQHIKTGADVIKCITEKRDLDIGAVLVEGLRGHVFAGMDIEGVGGKCGFF